MIEQNKQSRRQNIEQKRGQQAWKDILEIKGRSEKDQKEYRSLARGLNAMIQINGLGQTLGFLKAKGGGKQNAHFYLLGHLTHWMRWNFDTNNNQPNPAIPENNDGLLSWITNTASSADYRRATTECLAYGSWLRRFAEAELEAGEE